MKKFPHTWDGKEVTASLTGWSEYSTEDTPIATEPPIALSVQDVLNQIRMLRKTLNSQSLLRAIELLNDHVKNTNNPHKTNLDQFTQEVADILYKEYLNQGGTGSLDFYLQSLFYTLRVATIDEMMNTDDANLLISVKGANTFIRNHENDPEAHKELFDQWFPGIPITADPVMSVMGAYGISDNIIYIEDKEDERNISYNSGQDDTCKICETIRASSLSDRTVIYSIINRLGHIEYVNLNSGIYPDWGYRHPLLPCFGDHTNLLSNTDDITEKHMVCSNTEYSTDTSVIAPDGTPSATVVSTTVDAEPTEHSILIENFELTVGSTKTLSIFVKPAKCRYFSLRFEDMVATGVEAIAVYDLLNGTCTVMNDMGRYSGDIQHVGNGWFRCIFTMYHHIGQRANLIGTFFKINLENILDSFKYTATTKEKCGHVWGIQLEDTPYATPYVSVADTPVTYDGIYYQVDVDGIWDVNNMTMFVTFRNPGKWGYAETERPVFTIVDKAYVPIISCRMINTGETVIERYALKTVENTVVTVVDYVDRILPVESKWYQLAFTVGNNRIASCVNGRPGLGLSVKDKSRDGYRILIGCNQNAESFNGYIKELTIYDRCADDEELIFLTGEIIDE